jgi:hypothetical protein
LFIPCSSVCVGRGGGTKINFSNGSAKGELLLELGELDDDELLLELDELELEEGLELLEVFVGEFFSIFRFEPSDVSENTELTIGNS